MSTSLGGDVPRQLAVLLGREVIRIRRTNENPSRVSVIDVAMAVSGGTQHDAAKSLRRLCDQYPEVGPNWSHLKFKGRGQRETPVTDAKGIVEVIMLLQGQQAAQVRRQAAELLCRYLGGDLSLVDEVCALRGFQEQLAVRAPEDPRRLFGAEVEASSSFSGGPWAHVLSTVNERLTNQERMLARIQENLEQDRNRVNLNVRAPKRAAANQPEVARNLSGVGRAYPVAKFLDNKEKEDPSWKSARRSFAPAFSTVVQILKKNKLVRKLSFHIGGSTLGHLHGVSCLPRNYQILFLMFLKNQERYEFLKTGTKNFNPYNWIFPIFQIFNGVTTKNGGWRC